jgi:hypothetical protein
MHFSRFGGRYLNIQGFCCSDKGKKGLAGHPDLWELSRPPLLADVFQLRQISSSLS